ncbi:Thiamine biosynthesis lipoprotein ApbE precursor [Thalassoglobus neptunius]|uniref:FAD:protein FMN transferase n=1 Tax=Thalassoglobus neptunius TaxID=1938619 RepID=A0A5C5X265_9PLAN|nr:FAD:protein FMN transferase [Thalassoglobus neptunius]TWT57016.1 Thiamine biosynthesis lipoprotein ApbE precursor [Thalassoglobus neptunius]
MTLPPDSNRRDFLTGRAAKREIRHAGDEIADAILDDQQKPTAPVAGDTVRLETKAMGCGWSVIMNPGAPRRVMAASDAFDRVRDAEQMLTIYRDDSEIAKVNRSAAESPVSISESLAEFLSTCSTLFQDTGGCFDPATGRLIQLWKTARSENRIPTDQEIETALEQSGFQHVKIGDGPTVSFDRDLLLDFASIGKGYGIDQAADHLKYEEIDAFLVHGGQSSLIARGTHGEHNGWPVGLKNPLFTEQRYATILLKNVAMATSGSNIQYFRHEGRRYGHLLDPRTGWPAGGLLSVSVLAPTATEADALSTAFYVMGLDNALKYCDDHPQVGLIFVPPPSQGRHLEPHIRNIDPGLIHFSSDIS